MSSTSPERSFRIVTLAVALCLTAAIAVLGTEIVEYSRNTLDLNGRWVSSKTLMQLSIMGARHFLATRNALHRNRLNLGEWHGFNEVHLARPVQPSAIDCRFRLDPGAYLDVILDRTETGHEGIRLSRDERFPSQWYRAERSGPIRDRGRLAVPPARLGEGWHDLRLSFLPDGVLPRIDGDPLPLVPIRAGGERYIGLGGGLAAAVVDRVRILGPHGETVLDETFRNTRRHGLVAAATLALVLIGAAFVAAPVLTRSGPPMRLAAFRCLMLLIVGLVLLSVAFAFDYGFWSSRYVYGGFLPKDAKPFHLAIFAEVLRFKIFRAGHGVTGSISRAEDVELPAPLRRSLSAWRGPRSTPADRTARYRALSPLVPEFLDDAELRASPAKGPGALRVGFLGTSQTYGVGAETISETFVARVHARVAPALGGRSLETYNFSIPGSNSSKLLAHYRDSWRFVRPDLLVVNLSNNDPESAVLLENLRALAGETRRGGGEIVFLLEANTIEKDLRILLRMHDKVRSLGAELGVPVWDLHGYLASPAVYDSGRLWWDTVHLSSYGQNLTAEWLAERMIPLVRARLALPQGVRATVDW